MKFEPTLKFAREMDRADPLKKFRGRFHYPAEKGKPLIYFTGNSLGLQPRSVSAYLQQELDDWATLGVEGHVSARNPWMHYHKLSKASLARLTGARPSEVVAMNQLTVNLHLLMVSFYRPTRERYKIVLEAGAFPSDQYALESQVRFHGFEPDDALVEITLDHQRDTTGQVIDTIRAHGGSVALVMLGGVQYYTGEFFELGKITAAGHDAGAVVGFDLAHAIGNVPLSLHRDNVDFAVWCTYKYLNSGPGAVAGAFVHDRHGKDVTLPRFAGWWGHDEKERFLMKKGFKPMPGVDGWQLSNFSVLHAAPHLASLKIFDEAGFANIRKKSKLLTGFAAWLIQHLDPEQKNIRLLTPSDPERRGCQLSLYFHASGRKIFERLRKNGVVADWREPNVIRIAPAPLYNTYTEVFRFYQLLQEALEEHHQP